MMEDHVEREMATEEVVHMSNEQECSKERDWSTTLSKTPHTQSHLLTFSLTYILTYILTYKLTHKHTYTPTLPTILTLHAILTLLTCHLFTFYFLPSM